MLHTSKNHLKTKKFGNFLINKECTIANLKMGDSFDKPNSTNLSLKLKIKISNQKDFVCKKYTDEIFL